MVKRLLREALGIAVCCALFVAASAIAARVPLVVPPGVVGALALVALLASGALRLPWVAAGSDRLLRHLGLLFVPAAVLALRQRSVLEPVLLELGLVVVGSTTVGLVVAGVLTERLARVQGGRPDDVAAAREEEAGT